jgi:hypothetical protein
MGNPRGQSARRPKAKGSETPLVVYMWAVGLGVSGYLAGRLVFVDRPHPYHWAAAVLGVCLGIVAGWLWYRWRGDIVPGGRR